MKAILDWPCSAAGTAVLAFAGNDWPPRLSVSKHDPLPKVSQAQTDAQPARISIYVPLFTRSTRQRHQ
jgi:hypothetical protein